MSFYYTASSEHSICIGILNSDDTEINCINKALEVEILQKKNKTCIMKNLCIIALAWRKYEKSSRVDGRMFSTIKTM
jgi:hypothetical protein